MYVQKIFKGYLEDIQSPKDIFGISSGRLLDMHAMWDIKNNRDKCIETVKNKIMCGNKLKKPVLNYFYH